MTSYHGKHAAHEPRVNTEGLSELDATDLQILFEERIIREIAADRCVMCEGKTTADMDSSILLLVAGVEAKLKGDAAQLNAVSGQLTPWDGHVAVDVILSLLLMLFQISGQHPATYIAAVRRNIGNAQAGQA